MRWLRTLAVGTESRNRTGNALSPRKKSIKDKIVDAQDKVVAKAKTQNYEISAGKSIPGGSKAINKMLKIPVVPKIEPVAQNNADDEIAKLSNWNKESALVKNWEFKISSYSLTFSNIPFKTATVYAFWICLSQNLLYPFFSFTKKLRYMSEIFSFSKYLFSHE